MNTFIINSGSNSTTWLGVSYDTIFTTGITILIFFLGFLINKLFESRKEHKRLFEIRKYFYSLCYFLEKPVQIQIKVFEEYCNNLSTENPVNFTFKDTVDLDVKNLKSISTEDLYKILYLKKKDDIEIKTRRFNEITNSINYIEKQKENTSKNFTNFHNNFIKYESNWRSNLDEIFRFYNGLRSFNKQYNISHDPFLLELDKIIFQWSKLDSSSNIYVTFRELVTPLNKFCKENYADSRALSILNITLQATYAFKNMGKIKKEYAKLFEAEAIELDSKYKRLITAIEYFK